MVLIRKAALGLLVLLLSFSGIASAESTTVSGPNGTLAIEGSNQGNQVKLSLSYLDLSAEFTGFNLEIKLPAQLDETSGKFNSDNPAIQFSAAQNYDATTQLYKLVILSPALSSNPQGKKGKIGAITFAYKAGESPADLSLLLKTVRVYGGGEQILFKQDESLQLSVPDTTKPVVSAQPAGGIYHAAQSVSLNVTDNDPAAKIYYTLDETEPDAASAVYTGPILIVKDTTIKFTGIDSAGNQSDTVTETYRIDTSGPEVAGVQMKDAQTVEVAFNRAVSDETANASGDHFKVSKKEDAGAAIPVDTVTLNAQRTAAEIKLAFALETNVEYTLQVKGVTDVYGNGMAAPYSAALFIEDKQPPADIAGLKVEGTTKDTLTVSWQANTENDLDGYNVYLNGVFQEKVDSTLYTASGLTPDTDYELGVQAVDRSGNKASVISVKGRTQHADTEGPQVTAVDIKDAQTFTVSFNEPVSDDTAELSADHFKVFKPDDAGMGIVIASVALNAQKTAAEVKLAAVLEKNVEYTLQVKGVRDSVGNAMPDVYTHTLKIAVEPPPPVTDSVLSLEKSVDIAQPGEEFTIWIKAEAKDLYGFDLRFEYNPALVELVGSPLPHSDFGVPNSTASLFSSDLDGKMRIIGTRLGLDQGINGQVGLVELKFKAKDGNGLSGFSIGGLSELSDSNGTLQTQDTDIQSGVAVANPDLDGDGLAVNDLARVAAAYGKTSGDSGYSGRLDMNKDGKINILDIAYVAYKLLK